MTAFDAVSAVLEFGGWIVGILLKFGLIVLLLTILLTAFREIGSHD